MRLNATTRGLLVCAGLAAGAGISGANPGGYKCPCGPIGMPKNKYTTMYPNGDKFKLNCTNQAATGNFVSKFCKAGGGAVCIGECIYVGGGNEFCFTYDANGNPCTITHKNTDDATPDNPTHQRKVYVYDVKGGTVTTTCYKRNPDGTFTPVGRPTCRRVTFTASEADEDLTEPMEESLEDGALKFAAADDAAVEPQSAGITAAAEVELASGARDIRFFTSLGGDVPLHEGDRFTFRGVGLEAVTRLNSKFEASPRPDGGFDIVSLVEGVLRNDETLVRIGSDTPDPLDVQATSVNAASMTEILIHAACSEIIVPAEMFDVMSVDSYANIRAASATPDANHDGAVNAADLAIVLGGWGSVDGPSDVNRDGVVNNADLVAVLATFGYLED